VTRILVADDEPGLLEMLGIVLHSAGHEVVTALDGETAWAICSGPNPPDLAVLDIMMPGIDGMEVLHRIRQERRLDQVPVLILTARTDVPNRVAALDAGADDYVTKPFSSEELRARIASALRFRALAVELADRTLEAEHLSREIILAEERLRGELADQLHGEIVQTLAASRMVLERVAEGEDIPPGVRDRAGAVMALTDHALGVTRSLLRGLTPPMEGRGRLANLIRDEADRLSNSSGTKVEVTTPGDIEDLDPKVYVAVYRIIREAMVNAVKHAGASRVEVAIIEGPGELLLTVSDDGAGLAADSREAGAGYGMSASRLRAETIGATVSWTAGHDGGTVVTLTVPRDASAATPEPADSEETGSAE
jgi:signal transduction histidine kinase